MTMTIAIVILHVKVKVMQDKIVCLVGTGSWLMLGLTIYHHDYEYLISSL